MVNLLILAIATWQAVDLLRKSKIAATLRGWMESRQFFASLIGCGYCLSYWPAAVLWLFAGVDYILATEFDWVPTLVKCLVITPVRGLLWFPALILVTSKLSNLAHDLAKKYDVGVAPDTRPDLSEAIYEGE